MTAFSAHEMYLFWNDYGSRCSPRIQSMFDSCLHTLWHATERPMWCYCPWCAHFCNVNAVEFESHFFKGWMLMWKLILKH